MAGGWRLTVWHSMRGRNHHFDGVPRAVRGNLMATALAPDARFGRAGQAPCLSRRAHSNRTDAYGTRAVVKGRAARLSLGE